MIESHPYLFAFVAFMGGMFFGYIIGMACANWSAQSRTEEATDSETAYRERMVYYNEGLTAGKAKGVIEATRRACQLGQEFADETNIRTVRAVLNRN